MLGRLRSIFSWWIFAMDLGSFFALRIAQFTSPREGAFSGCSKFAQTDGFQTNGEGLPVHPAPSLSGQKGLVLHEIGSAAARSGRRR